MGVGSRQYYFYILQSLHPDASQMSQVSPQVRVRGYPLNGYLVPVRVCLVVAVGRGGCWLVVTVVVGGGSVTPRYFSGWHSGQGSIIPGIT